jgi:preprotein translocase subunit SecG
VELKSIINIIQIIIAILLVIVVLAQVKGQGTSLFGPAESSYRTYRGIEKLLFNMTIVLMVVFIVSAILFNRLTS